MKQQKKFVISILIIVGIVIVISVISNNLKLLALSSDSCNLGSWDVLTADKTKLVINASIPNLHSQGCLGTYKVNRIGVDLSQELCDYWGFDYDIENNDCKLENLDWFRNKYYTSNIVCTHTHNYRCIEPNPEGFTGSGCVSGSVYDGSLANQNYNPFFDGYYVRFNNLKRTSDDFVRCAGSIFVTLEPQEELNKSCSEDFDCEQFYPEAEDPTCSENQCIVKDNLNKNLIILFLIIILGVIGFAIYERRKNG